MEERILSPKGEESRGEENRGKRSEKSWKGNGKGALAKIPLYFVPLAIFGIIWMIMSWYDVFFFWKAVSAVIVATVSVSPIKSILGLKKEESTAGSIGVVWCLFLLILVGHYATPKENLSAEKPKEKNGIVRQAGVLKNVGDVWVVDNIFYKNDEIIIEVTGGPVEMVNGETFLSGKYHQKADTTGCIGFEALSNEPTKVRVWFKK